MDMTRYLFVVLAINTSVLQAEQLLMQQPFTVIQQQPVQVIEPDRQPKVVPQQVLPTLEQRFQPPVAVVPPVIQPREKERRNPEKQGSRRLRLLEPP